MTTVTRDGVTPPRYQVCQWDDGTWVVLDNTKNRQLTLQELQYVLRQVPEASNKARVMRDPESER